MADLSPFAVDDVLRMYERMRRIRQFEQRVSLLYRDGEVPGFVHLSIGQEATAVGACWNLSVDDVITSNHRGHAHCLAKGLSPESMFAELMGRVDGSNRGRGGSMHIADPSQGIFGANGIVAAGIPIAVGAAAAHQLAAAGRVAVAFFGDGAVAQGAFHEAVNLAALWRLPVIFFCENNGYAEFSPASEQHPVPLRQRAAAYGMAFHEVDGNDVVAVARLMHDVVATVRAGGGPVLVEATTYRWHGHYEGDPERYRDEEEKQRWASERDPLRLAADALLAAGVAPETLAAIDATVADSIEAAVRTARESHHPAPTELDRFVYRAPRPEAAPAAVSFGAPFRVMDGIRRALTEALEEDERVFLAGIDVGAGGNVFGLTRGLRERFPSRVRDTPISETAIVGLAVGAAMAGFRPVVEIMYLDFLGVCFDQILNQAAKMGFMTGGKASLGLTVRTQYGVGRSSGSQHSQSLEALLAHIPGLKVVMPATAADAYGLLRASIADPDPVIVIENRLLYGHKDPEPGAGYTVPIGVARVARAGSDVTVVCWSRMVHEALAAAEQLAGESIDVEVIDLRTVAPIDYETILESVSRTTRLIIAQESVLRHGIGAEIAARAGHDGYWLLDAPIIRLGGPFTPVPYSPVLEAAWLPDRADIVRAARDLVRF